MPFHLIRHEPVPAGLRRIALEEIDIVLSMFAEKALPVGEKVHALRSRCKKLRSLLRLPRSVMGEAFTVESRRFRAAARELAGHRDSDVAAKVLSSFNGYGNGLVASGNEVPAEDIDRALVMMRTARDAVDRWPIDDCDFTILSAGCGKTYRTCLRKWHDLLANPNDESFHRCRKWTKYHWYQVRLLEGMNTSELRLRRARLRKLQMFLGDAHDIVLVQHFLAAHEFRDADLLARLLDRKQELYDQALDIGHQVYAVSERDLLATLSRWWRDWQR